MEILKPTLKLSDAAARRWDVVVIGAGVAGSVAAHALARQGVAVLLVEKAQFPRDKVCGGCLNFRAVSALQVAGLNSVLEASQPGTLHTFELHQRTRQAALHLPAGRAISRRTLDMQLAQAAIHAGAAFLPGVMAELVPPHNNLDEEVGQAFQPARNAQVGKPAPLFSAASHQLSCVGSPGSTQRDSRIVHLRQVHNVHAVHNVDAALVLAADGLGGRTASRLGKVHIASASRIGAGVLLPPDRPEWSAFPSGVIQMFCGKTGYLGAVRVEENKINLAAALDVKQVQTDGLNQTIKMILEEAKHPAAECVREYAWLATPALTRHGPLAGERVFVLGDAAGYVEPFTGEGMAWAITGALMAVPIALKVLHEGWSADLQRQWETEYGRQIRSRQRLCRIVSNLLRHDIAITSIIKILQYWPNGAGFLLKQLNAPWTAVEPRGYTEA